MSRTGGCLCGAIRYEVGEDAGHLNACHCETCRRWTRGIYIAHGVPKGGLAWSGAEPARYRSSDWAERWFCGTCGTNLCYYTTMDGAIQGFTALCAGTLDDAEGLSLEREIWIDAKPAGYALAGEHSRLTRAEFLKSIGLA